MAALELQDLHLHGRAFTWSNERENPTLVRLDRVLVSMDWEELFPNAHLQGLGSDASDHCPLLLQTNLGRTAGCIKPGFTLRCSGPSSRGHSHAGLEET